MIKVTILIPSYNHAHFLRKRLDSIINQTYKNWELIIIDDNSTDDSLIVLNEFANNYRSKIKYFIVNKTNSGSGYNSWKKGIELAETDYVWIAETDDYSSENFLTEQIEILDKSEECALVFCSSVYVDKDESYLYDSSKRTKNLNVVFGQYKFFDSSEFMIKMPLSPYITNGSSVVFRKPKHKLPDELFSHRQSADQFLWSYLLLNSTFCFLNKNLNYFRRHENATSNVISQGKGLLNTYKELLTYLNYFKIKNKNRELINSYMNVYIRRYKNDFYKLEIFGNNNSLKILYITSLALFAFKYFIRKIDLFQTK